MTDLRDYRASVSSSKRMRAVRQEGTAPEIRVRRVMRDLGFRYRNNNRALAGKPDLSNRELGLAVFVHGCFWHRHVDCKRSTTPTRNVDLWKEKFSKTVQRDEANARSLRALGLYVLVIWECETLDHQLVRTKIESALRYQEQVDAACGSNSYGALGRIPIIIVHDILRRRGLEPPCRNVG